MVRLRVRRVLSRTRATEEAEGVRTRTGSSSRSTRAALVALCVAAGVMAGVTSSTPPPTGLQGRRLDSQRLPGRQVWAHLVPHGLPDYVEEGGAPGYGSLFPLDLVGGDWRAPARPTSGLRRALQAGLTGVQVLQFDDVNRGSDFVREWMSQADATWEDSNQENNFSVAPCFSASTPEGVVRLAREYHTTARGHPSAARVEEKLVVYVYGTHSMTPGEWQLARSRLTADGIDLFWIVDLQTDASQHNMKVPVQVLDGYVKQFEAHWLFEDSTGGIWPELTDYIRSRHLSYAGGIMPGYDRETVAEGGYVDARGTREFRDQWEVSLALDAPWVNVVTWNDMVEHTEIKASSDWNVTRQDINAFYAAKFRRTAFPRASAELYVTVPSFVRLGETLRAEGLVLNGGSAETSVSIRLVDSAGRSLGGATSAVVSPGTAGDATTSAVVTRYPAGRFVRAEAWTLDSNGAPLQKVLSAPVVIYGDRVEATPMMRKVYYSIPAARSLPGQIHFQVTSHPEDGSSTSQALVSTSQGTTPRFIQVLQNTRSAGLAIDKATLVSSIPMKPTMIIGGQAVSAAASGFYVARVIDQDERVGYSAPVFIDGPEMR